MPTAIAASHFAVQRRVRSAMISMVSNQAETMELSSVISASGAVMCGE
jgi:hypothetical protein